MEAVIFEDGWQLLGADELKRERGRLLDMRIKNGDRLRRAVKRYAMKHRRGGLLAEEEDFLLGVPCDMAFSPLGDIICILYSRVLQVYRLVSGEWRSSWSKPLPSASTRRIVCVMGNGEVLLAERVADGHAIELVCFFSAERELRQQFHSQHDSIWTMSCVGPLPTTGKFVISIGGDLWYGCLWEVSRWKRVESLKEEKEKQEEILDLAPIARSNLLMVLLDNHTILLLDGDSWMVRRRLNMAPNEKYCKILLALSLPSPSDVEGTPIGAIFSEEGGAMVLILIDALYCRIIRQLPGPFVLPTRMFSPHLIVAYEVREQRLVWVSTRDLQISHQLPMRDEPLRIVSSSTSTTPLAIQSKTEGWMIVQMEHFDCSC